MIAMGFKRQNAKQQISFTENQVLKLSLPALQANAQSIPGHETLL